MKEATGELNMTVITVVAIAAVGLLFTIFVWPNIQANLALSTACSNVNSKGSYNTASGALTGSSNEGQISCSGFSCTVFYEGKSYTRGCRD